MTKNNIPFVPPLLFVGVLVILIPIFTFITTERIKRQDEFIAQKMLERGTALIRTFEAGTRTGMFTMRWGASRIQTMLQETAAQPEIEYITIVSGKGKILAHSNPEQVGQTFNNMPAIPFQDQDPFPIYHRIEAPESEAPVFEVYKRFVPVRKPSNRMNRRMRQMHEQEEPSEIKEMPEKSGINDWSRHYLDTVKNADPQLFEHYIFVGLSLEKARALKHQLLKETIFRSLILFLLGLAGLLALFAFQAYRGAKASLSSVKAFSDTIVQNMPSGLVTIGPDHQITSMNQTARQVIGGEITTPFSEWIELINTIDTADPVVSREMSIVKKDGQIIGLDVIASKISGQEDHDMGFLLLFRDLSQIRELQKQVETNKRLAAIGKLAAGVAHEIRNPLSSIKGFATYFAKRYKDNPVDLETASIMIGEVERINRSVTQLLEFSNPMVIEKKWVDMDRLIRHSLKLVQQDLEQKRIEIRVDIATEVKEIFTDPDRMNQVFLNLYINAIDALDKNGRLSISVRDMENKKKIEIRISDNGYGIDQAILDRIFDPYFTTRANGTGLGLSIVHKIIENLSGNIRVESTKNQGTCFIVQLPSEPTVSDSEKGLAMDKKNQAKGTGE